MATFRIDQATPGAGTAGQSRHDLVPGEVITLVATAPTGGGVTYAWEILDKVGSAAVLSSTTGLSVTIGLAGAITQPCAFLIRLTANDNGTITVTERIASVRSAVGGLRAPLFPETAPTTNRLNANTPDSSTDNAVYADRAGLGASGQNWRGWGEWAYEVILAIESAFGSGGPPTGAATGDLSGTYPAPVVDGIQGRAVVATAPTDGQVYAWNNGASQWEPITISGAPSGPATGDLSGTYPGPTVDALQGVALSAAAPAGGDVLQYNSGTLEWEPAAFSSGTTSLFVYEEGGVAGGNVYTTWSALYTAASAVAGVKIVRVSDASGVPEISAGAYDFGDWIFVGYINPTTGSRPTIIIRTAVTISGNFRAERLVFQMDSGASVPIVYAGSSTRVFELVDTDLDGGVGASGFFFVSASGAGVRLVMRGTSRIFSLAAVITGGNFSVDLYDRSQVDGDAFGGGGGVLTIRVMDPDTTRYALQPSYGVANVASPKSVWNGPLNEEQLGTTELHIGSVYLDISDAPLRLHASTHAMIGGAVVADTAILNIREFLGGALVASITRTGLLDDQTLDGGVDVDLVTGGWYDFFLVAGGAAETAIIKGLQLVVVRG